MEDDIVTVLELEVLEVEDDTVTVAGLELLEVEAEVVAGLLVDDDPVTVDFSVVDAVLTV